MQIVIFLLGEKRYAFKTEKVLEISKDANPTIVPNSPDWVEGLVNLRGDIVTMINLSKVLQLDDSLCYNKFIILDNDDEKIGLMVTEVIEVVDIEDEQLQKVDNSDNTGVVGIVKLDDEIINIIDINSLMKKEG